VRGPKSPRTAEYLRHIAEAIDLIQTYTAGLDATGFRADRKTQDAVIRNLEVIGEACNNIAKHDPDFTHRHAHIPWGFAYEMRNALIHGYFKIDVEIVWTTVTLDIPGLKNEISRLQPLV